MPTLILFDVDATLLLTAGLGMECMAATLAELHGVPVDPRCASFSGRLDPHIARELSVHHGLAFDEVTHARFRERYARLLDERLAAEPGRARALEGVTALLDALQPRVELGLLTGNYPETARAKVAAAGIDPDRFRVGAFGSDGDHRRELPPVAIARHAERSGRTVPASDVLIVGDTPLDVDCARANGCLSLAVATGRFSSAELLAAGADRVVESLEECLWEGPRDELGLLEWIAGP